MNNIFISTKNNKLIKLNNVIVTSHIAGYSDDFLYNFWKYSVDTIIDLSKKQWPKSCVNPVVNSRWGIKYDGFVKSPF